MQGTVGLRNFTIVLENFIVAPGSLQSLSKVLRTLCADISFRVDLEDFTTSDL